MKQDDVDDESTEDILEPLAGEGEAVSEEGEAELEEDEVEQVEDELENHPGDRNSCWNHEGGRRTWGSDEEGIT